MSATNEDELFQSIHAVAEEVGTILSDFVPHEDWPAAQGRLIELLRTLDTNGTTGDERNFTNLIVIGALRGMCFDDFDSL
jgi:hypothetical protein